MVTCKSPTPSLGDVRRDVSNENMASAQDDKSPQRPDSINAAREEEKVFAYLGENFSCYLDPSEAPGSTFTLKKQFGASE